MIYENLSEYVRITNECWVNGQAPQFGSELNVDIYNPQAFLFQNLPFYEYHEGDDLLKNLFFTLKNNYSLSNVEMAVIALDSVYHTRLNNPIKVAKNIFSCIDKDLFEELLICKSLSLPKRRTIIDKLTIANKNDDPNSYYIYSFATKFLSFISPTQFPIYDRFAATLLYKYLLNKNCRFDDQKIIFSRFGDYSYYIRAYDEFRIIYGLTDYSYKDIDEFLWCYGKVIEKSSFYGEERINFNSVQYIPVSQRFKVAVKVDAHVYAEGELRDDYLTKEKLGTGIKPLFIMQPLSYALNKTFLIEYDDSTEIGRFQETINELIWGKVWNVICEGVYPVFVDGLIQMNVIDPRANFRSLLNKYFDKNDTGYIQVIYNVSEDAGRVWEEKNLRFYLHSKESGRHNTPHVHVENINRRNEASISLIDGRVLDGTISKKDLKTARIIIDDNKEFFLDSWNRLTDGLRVDINRGLGIIK